MNERDTARQIAELTARLDKMERDTQTAIAHDPVPGDVAAMTRVIVVPNDDYSPAPDVDSEQVVVREISEPAAYAGKMAVGEPLLMRTWWPYLNSHFSAMAYRAELATGDEIDGAFVLPAFLIEGEWVVWHLGVFMPSDAAIAAMTPRYGHTSGFPPVTT